MLPQKYDIAAAYRCATLWGTLAHHCIFLFETVANATVALMGLHITFGGTGGPFKWCPFSETFLYRSIAHCAAASAIAFILLSSISISVRVMYSKRATAILLAPTSLSPSGVTWWFIHSGSLHAASSLICRSRSDPTRAMLLS